MSLDEEFTLDDLIKLSQKDYISFDIKKSDFFPDEFLVYTMLKSNKKLKQEIDDSVLIGLTLELVNKLKRSIKVNWQKDELYSNRIFLMIKIILEKYKYPIDENEWIAHKLLLLADWFTNEWIKERS